MKNTYETEKATCAAMIVPSPNATPDKPNSAAVAKPMTISGTITGRNTSASAACLNATRYRARAMAAAVPTTVASNVVEKPTTRLVLRAETSSASFHASTYQCQVNPRQIVLKRES